VASEPARSAAMNAVVSLARRHPLATRVEALDGTKR
jgi:hypothetical protein